MRFLSRFALAPFVIGALALAHPAAAGCKRMGFTVNDYGKEGPTRDAKDLLDKHVATWAAEQGIEKYSVGKKDVNCELFLNLIVVDEHTCTASANVCWGPDLNKVKQEVAKTKDTEKKKKTDTAAAPATGEETSAKTVEKKAEEKAAEKPAEPSTPAAATASETPAADVSKAAAAKSETPSSAPEATVETGAIPVPTTAAAAAAAVSPATLTPADTANHEASKATAAAAEAAAAAAERAAAAAERAADAAERAAAAVAQQQASQPPVSTPAAADASASTSPATTTSPEASASVPVAPVTPTP